jgi:tetratricopeptide (TPR) repeat protein
VIDTSVSASYIDAIFYANDQQAQMSTLAQTSLSQGADLFTNGNYDGAIKAFRRSIALDPSKDNAPRAFDLLATTYVQQNKTDDAIKAYKSSLSIVPNDDNALVKLGNLYFDQGNFGDAEKAYKNAVKVNPASSTNLYSLGQVYLKTDRTTEAEQIFQQVIRMDRTQHAGYYALGQTYSKEGRYADAIDQFGKVISLKKDFYNAYIDLGSAYADLGQMDKAQEQVDILSNVAPSLVSLLTGYIDQTSKPNMIAAFSPDGFNTSLGPNTLASQLNSSLSSPGSKKVFTMEFMFDKAMNLASVQNPLNWTISRASWGQPGGAYNWGLATPTTEATVTPIPTAVIVDQTTSITNVYFQISQNATGDGAIDPSHIIFQFKGKDAYGNAMDPKADQYGGISKFV